MKIGSAITTALALLQLYGSADAFNFKVHFVPHSHMDAGWLKTYDVYYTSQVRHIFDEVFSKLETNDEYTYTIGDLAYFRRFYSA